MLKDGTKSISVGGAHTDAHVTNVHKLGTDALFIIHFSV